MANLIECGTYIEDGVAVPIVCDPSTGDVVIMCDMLGHVLLEYQVVTNPRSTENIDVTGLIKHFDADGVFATTDGWAVIKDNTVSYYNIAKYGLDKPEYVSKTSLDVDYDN